MAGDGIGRRRSLGGADLGHAVAGKKKMMRGNQALAPWQALMLPLLLMASYVLLAGVSSTRDPTVGVVPFGDAAGRRSVAPRRSTERELDCCNQCDCNKDSTVCTCQDRQPRGCSVGCQDCRRERGRGYYCRDTVDGCPESCDYDYDYDDGRRGV